VCPALAECAGVTVGPEARQLAVLDALYSLAHAFNIDHGQGFILRALLRGDLWTARELAVAFDQYNAGLVLVHEALQNLNE
jgi:hypothetical protein